jgi:hypothetical protein
MSQYSEFFLVGNAKYETVADRLRLRSYGSWLTEELWLRENQNKKRAEFSLRTIRLARRIAKERNITEDEAFDLLQGDANDRQEQLGEYAEEAAGLFLLLPTAQDQFEELVTKFFQNRGEVRKGTEWSPTVDWSRDDTGKLTAPMLRLVEAFMTSEELAAGGEDDGDRGDAEAPKEPA